MKCLLWMVSNDGLKTSSKWLLCGMNSQAVCPLCQAYEETRIHLLRECPTVKPLWHAFVNQHNNSTSFSRSLEDWMEANLNPSNRQHWHILFGIIIWWYHRKQHVFFPNKLFSVVGVIQHVQLMLAEVVECCASKFPHPTPSLTSKWVGWQFPNPLWVKYNIDGSLLSAEGVASCGGRFRHSQGWWIFGFSCRLGRCSILMADLWGIEFPLQLAWANGIRHLLIESDSAMVIQIILKGCPPQYPCGRMIAYIQ